jgi:phospholipid transport system substrate-binding protein
MISSRTIAAVAVFAILACAPHDVPAGAPTDQMRSDIEALYGILQRDPQGQAGEREASAILDRMFDWAAMARAALRDHWQARTAPERTEFTRLFAGVFRRAYLSRASVVDGSRFRYVGDTADGDRALVKTKVLTRRGSTVDVDYLVRLREQRWRVEDVLVERVSLVDNYRTQFDAVLARSSYATLADKLRRVAR